MKKKREKLAIYIWMIFMSKHTNKVIILIDIFNKQFHHVVSYLIKSEIVEGLVFLWSVQH